MMLGAVASQMLTRRATAPINIVLPAISGTASSAETLSATAGIWNDGHSEITGYAYQWKADGVAIGGATASTFELTDTQIGTVITVAVTATNAVGSTDATSEPTAEVTAGFDFTQVKLQLSLDGLDGAVATSDESNSAHAVTFTGTAQLDTAQFKFDGGSSLLLDGNSDWISCANHADFLFGAGPFTAELFFRRATIATSQLFGIFGTSTAWRILIDGNDVYFQYSENGTDIFTPILASAGSIATNTWYHVAVDRNPAGLVRVYFDGVMIGSATVTADFFDGTNPLTIGASSNAGNRNYFNGHIDEVRVINGRAQYDTDAGFTPPTAPFPTS